MLAISERALASLGVTIGSSCGQAAICLTLIGMQVASAASSVHQQVTVAKQDPGARLSGKRSSSYCPSCCAALPHDHSACWPTDRPQRPPAVWLELEALIRLASMRTRNLPLAIPHCQVHQGSQLWRLPYASFSVAQAPPSPPVALVPEASSSTRGWGEFVRHLHLGYRARFRCPEAGWRAVSPL
jgi:hypothetical protein